MKVFITMTADGYNDVVIDKVFSTLSKACKHIINTRFKSNSFYSKMTPDEQRKQAQDFVEVHDII